MKKYYKEITEYPLSAFGESGVIELLSAASYYDVDTFDYSLVLRMRNIGQRKIRKAKIRLSLFLDTTVFPYKKIDYTYVFGKKEGEMLGERVHIPIPQSFFKSFEVVLREVEFEDGEKLSMNLSSKKKKMSVEKRVAPPTVHDRLAPLTSEKRIAKAEFIERRDSKPTDEKKELIIENELEKVEKRERYKDKMRIQALPRIALYFIIVYLIYFLLRLLTETVLK